MGAGRDGPEKILLDRRLPRSERKSAAWALGRSEGLGSKAAEARAAVLEAVLLDEDEDHRLRAAAAGSLGLLGRRRSVPSLLAALDGRCPALRHEAVKALGSLGCPEAAPALEKLLLDRSRYLRRLASRAIIDISGIPEGLHGGKDREGLFFLLASGDERVAEALVGDGGSARSFLLDKLSSNSFYERQLSSWALAVRARKALDARKREGQKGAPHPYPASPRDLSRLYSFRVHRRDGAVVEVENSGFDEISRVLRGRGRIGFHPPKPVPAPDFGVVDLGDLLSEMGVPRILGRTLVFDLEDRCLAVKFPSKPGDEGKLSWEASVQRCMKGISLQGSIPEPLGGLLEVKGMDTEMRRALSATGSLSLAYTAKRDYFTYLNHQELTEREFQKGLEDCASDLGRITARGMIHRSLIPLFHRREASPSRPDGGAYRWSRRVVGRLEAWAESCRYPNLRLSGLADFEHVELWESTPAQDLQEAVGEHLLSLCLIAGSYFRSREAFEVSSAERAVKSAFRSYLRSLIGREPELMECIDWEEIASRMKEEMSSGDHLGLSQGPFPLPEMVRAIHLASLLAVLDLSDRWASEKG